MGYARGARVKYVPTPGDLTDPMEGMTGTVTHLDGDENGEYNNAGQGDNEVWVDWDKPIKMSYHWVETKHLSLL